MIHCNASVLIEDTIWTIPFEMPNGLFKINTHSWNVEYVDEIKIPFNNYAVGLLRENDTLWIFAKKGMTVISYNMKSHEQHIYVNEKVTIRNENIEVVKCLGNVYIVPENCNDKLYTFDLNTHNFAEQIFWNKSAFGALRDGKIRRVSCNQSMFAFVLINEGKGYLCDFSSNPIKRIIDCKNEKFLATLIHKKDIFITVKESGKIYKYDMESGSVTTSVGNIHEGNGYVGTEGIGEIILLYNGKTYLEYNPTKEEYAECERLPKNINLNSEWKLFGTVLADEKSKFFMPAHTNIVMEWNRESDVLIGHEVFRRFKEIMNKDGFRKGIAVSEECDSDLADLIKFVS